MNRRTIAVMAVVWISVIVAAASSMVTLYLSGGHAYGFPLQGESVRISREDFDMLMRYKHLEQIREITLRDYYVDVDPELLMDGAAHGMLQALGDPYTFYYNQEELEEMSTHNEGNYVGVGIQVVVDPKDQNITVARVFENSPAQRAGMISGDKLVAVEGQTVTGFELQSVVNSLKGKEGSSVAVTVLRGEEMINMTLTRASVVINRVEYQMLENQIGYIAIYEFMGDDVKGFMSAVEALQKQNAQALILDLRSNPGGLLDHVVSIADVLLPEGNIVYIEDRHGRRVDYDSDAEMLGLPMAVLVDGLSASASEVLAGAIQDHGVGTIVGEQTFGKGIVQTVLTFDDNKTGMQLTTARYYTPKGRSIHEIGIKPDAEVVPPERENPGLPLSREEDVQLQEAIRILRER